MRELPGVLREIAEVVGVEAAVRIADLRGGARVNIPSRVTPDCWLSLAVGEDKAKALSRHFTSGYTSIEILVPLGPTGARAEQAREIERLLNEGLSGGQIARQLRISHRTVTRHKLRLRRMTQTTEKSPGPMRPNDLSPTGKRP